MDREELAYAGIARQAELIRDGAVSSRELGMSRTYCFTPIWNHTGQPAAAIPAGFTASGLPLSRDRRPPGF